MQVMTYRSTPPWLVPARRWVLDMIPLPVLRQALYVAQIGRWGHFADPKTFNEKVNWRIFNDRRDRIIKACDKMWMKEMAREACPSPDLRIPATYWSGTDLREAPDLTSLPPWVLKPNHSSGHALFGPDPQTELASAIEQTRSWLEQTPWELGEWGYSQARPLLLLEERISTPSGRLPVDYKFFVFDGRVELIQVNRGRYSNHQSATFLNSHWRQLPVRWLNQPVADEHAPAEFDKMMDIASALGAGWDFVRIDLYAVDGDVWFGEYTPYPGSGLRRYEPASFDLEQGLQWKLPTLAEVQRGRP